MSVVIHLGGVVIHDDLGDLGRLTSDPRIDKYVNKYGEMLFARSSPRIAVKDNLGVNWLGRTHWSTREPDVSLIVIQRRALADERSLERVVAHEMIHHVVFTNNPAWTISMVRQKRFEGHGDEFMKFASMVNRRMGEGFVTEKSDESYISAPETKPYILAIVPRGQGQYGWAWAVRLTPKAARYFEYLREKRGAILVRTTDPRWAKKGPRLGESRGIGVPQNVEDQEELRKVYEQIILERKQLEN
jgi:hypothetical protein